MSVEVGQRGRTGICMLSIPYDSQWIGEHIKLHLTQNILYLGIAIQAISCGYVNKRKSGC